MHRFRKMILAPYESVWVDLTEGPKTRDALKIKGLGKFDRKTGELRLEDTGFARSISCRALMIKEEKERNRTCAPCLQGFSDTQRPTCIHLEA